MIVQCVIIIFGLAVIVCHPSLCCCLLSYRNNIDEATEQFSTAIEKNGDVIKKLTKVRFLP